MTQVPEGLNQDIEEPELGRLQRDPSADPGRGDAVEESAAYERAVEEDTVLPPEGSEGDAAPADDERPLFQEPGGEPQ